MSFYTTKPVKYLRVPSQLYALDFADTIVSIANHVFAPFQTANSERDVLALRKARHKHHNAPVISLCKHAPGDLNFDISRVYDEDLNFLRFSGFKELSRATFASNTYILFDEDIGGGYGVKCLKQYFRDFQKANIIEETTIRFDPKFEEVLDLKDFIYKFDKTSGLVMENKITEGTKRVAYIECFNILEKFASIKPEYVEKVAIMFWIISAYYHKEFCNASRYKECIEWLESYQFDIKIIEEIKDSFTLMTTCFDILRGE